MKMKKFIQTSTRYRAKKSCPWAAVIAKVNGGFMAFESHYDYEIWKNQK
jgi:hypothetical protein